ncbi:MAG TPA: DUF58 domain-containing protein [Actinomycetes bacterium]|nr:DUF58 domain-containing protein [Actinomycetes bacterium]
MGIVECSLLAGQPELLLILPAPDPTVHVPQRLGASIGDLDPDGLQPYTPGTPIGRIHWPALARGAGLQQRRLAPPRSGRPLVAVDTAGASDPRAVDWVARAAAGIILRLAQSGGCRVLLPGDQAATTITDTAAGWRGVHPPPGPCGASERARPAGPAGDGQAPMVDPGRRHARRGPRCAATAAATRRGRGAD